MTLKTAARYVASGNLINIHTHRVYVGQRSCNLLHALGLVSDADTVVETRTTPTYRNERLWVLTTNLTRQGPGGMQAHALSTQ